MLPLYSPAGSMGDDPSKKKNAVHELENWRIRIRTEEKYANKWDDWWGWMVKVCPLAALCC